MFLLLHAAHLCAEKNMNIKKYCTFYSFFLYISFYIIDEVYSFQAFICQLISFVSLSSVYTRI